MTSLERRRLLEHGERPLPVVSQLTGVDAEVERRAGQAEHVEPAAERRQPAVCDPRAAVRAEARLDEVELRAELVGRRVAVGAEPFPDRREPAPVRLGRIAIGWETDGRDGVVRIDERARHAPGGRERADVAPQQVADELRATLDRLAHRLGARVGVSVEVAADPRAEPERAPGKALAPGRDETGGGVPEAVLEEPERLPDLVDDARAVGPDLVRLPEDGDLLRERRLPLAALRRRQADVVELVEELGDPTMLLEDRARQRLGRVRRENELDRDPLGSGRDLLRGDRVSPEELDGLGERLARRSAQALVLSAAPHPVVLLGDVGEVEVDGEGAEDDGLRLDVERRDRLGERSGGAFVAAPPEACEEAHPLLEAEDALALLLGEDPPEDLPEEPDVRAERSVWRGVGRVAHGSHSARPQAVAATRRRVRSASRPARGPSPPRRRGRAPARR